MNESYNLKSIIIKRAAFRENDLKVTMYSLEKGKIALIARGAKKIKSKMAGHLEPFCFSEIMVINGRQLEYIGSAANICAFRGIKENLLKLAAAGKAFKIFDRLIKENEPDENVFNLFLEFLQVLNGEKKIKPEVVSNLFIFKLLSELGYQPDLYSCVSCQAKVLPKGNGIDYNKGGLICPKCQPESKSASDISENCIKLLRISCQKELSFLAAIKTNKSLEAELSRGVSFFLNSF